MLKLEYVVVVPNDLSAGLWGFSDNVTVSFQDCEPDRFDLLPEAVEHFRKAIAEWYDVRDSSVVTKEEYDRESARLAALEEKQEREQSEDN
jgi:hypothetical protein